MKVLVVHDKAGKIKRIAIPAKEFGAQIGLEGKKGELVSEVDLPDVKYDLANVQDENKLQKLIDITKQYKIEVGPGKSRLIRR